MSKSVTLLNQRFTPQHYVLSLSPDKQKMSFEGTVIISGKKIGQPTKRLTFHQKGLKVTKATITRHDKKGDQELRVTRINAHKAYDEVRLHTDQTIYPGNVTVRLEFSGKITRQMNGIYPCFFNHDGEQKKLIATQFESHYAREVFPCIDEPEAKATFQLTLTTPEGETVLSNTPPEKQDTTNGLTTTTFEKTPHMSTYLLAFIYGEMGYEQSKSKSGTQVRIYATASNVALTDFALDFATKALDFYEDYFGIPYPLEKCDHIALPDFASGAMENWGCITYREQALLIDEEHSPLSMKQRVAMVIAHELAHQWFGNLVTMRWWTDLWLNEGFASWIEFLAVDHIFPEWNVWTQFLVDEQQQALKLDALEHTHPVEVPIKHPDEIRSIFDTISYSKGASVIHMLQDYLGAEAFRAGLKHYLKKHEYGNTDTVDLWRALEEISGKPVMDFMHAWTSTSGFPLVNAEVENNRARITQRRFYVNPPEKPGEQLWPIALQTTESTEEESTFDQASLALTLKDPDHFLINQGSAGFYRVSYNSSHMQRLGSQIQKGHVPPEDRLGLLADIIETAKAGKTSTVDALEFVSHFEDETDYAVWDIIAGVLGSVRLVMHEEEIREAMKPFVRHLVAKELERLGWEKKDDESHFDSLLRPVILGIAANVDDPETVEHAKALFKKAHDVEDISADIRRGRAQDSKQVKRGNSIDSDLRSVVFGTVARLGDEKTFDKLVELHRNAHLSDEKVTIAAALTSFRQEKLIKRALGMIKSEDVRLQDVAYWMAYSLMNRHAREITWQWIKDNWDWLEENLGSDLSFYRIPIYVARVRSDKEFIKEYKAFFEPKLSPSFERAYNQGLEMLQWQSAWKDRDYKEVLTLFKNRK
ncbi:MAG: M1 family metallopeptidase [Candidatus Saccharibacteria bacterium]|nr:M1 family metallopeptidase [Candidatus Saccharibacteria bacterium]